MITQFILKDSFHYNDGHLFWKERINPAVNINNPAGCNSCGARVIRINKKLYLEHRLVFLFHHGYLPKKIDHINGDRSNNKIENLRECTSAQNSWNSKTPTTNTSGVKGVSWNDINKRWRARFKCNKKIIEVGSFIDIDQAKKAIEDARKMHHGNFAKNG